MAIQNDDTLITKGDLKNLYSNKILPYLGGNFALATNVSDYYSTDEKIVGVWTDGRPIYQKTYFTGALPNNSSKEVSTGVSNIDDIISIAGYAIENSEYWYPITYANTSAYVIKTYYRKSINSIVINTYADWGSNTNSCVTLQYTKTTDSAGSAAATPGCYDINRPDLWPTNQEIFFGNGVYGYRAKGNFTATAAGATFVLNLVANAANFTIVNTGGSVKVTNTGGSTVMRMFGVNWSQTDNKPTTVTLIDKGTNNYLRFQAMFVTDKATTSNTYDVWVTYTK